jgi:hypothetical protein
MMGDIKASASCWFIDQRNDSCLQGNLQDTEACESCTQGSIVMIMLVQGHSFFQADRQRHRKGVSCLCQGHADPL